jgi:hypothetical protein
MTTSNSVRSIYHVPIQEYRDIERAVDFNEESHQRVFSAISLHYGTQLDKIVQHPNLGELFKQAHWESLSFDTCKTVLACLDRCKTIFNSMESIWASQLMPSFFEVFRVHQEAVRIYTESGETRAVKSFMAKIDEVTGRILGQYGDFKWRLLPLLKGLDDICFLRLPTQSSLSSFKEEDLTRTKTRA